MEFQVYKLYFMRIYAIIINNFMSKFIELKGVKKNVSLAEYMTFKIGGRAKYFFEAKSKEDLISALKWAKEKKMPCFVFGGGSNVLFSDKNYKGLAIKMGNSAVGIKNSVCRILDCDVEIEAGAKLGKLVAFASKNSLSGLEWAAGIPGTVGGAVSGNAQAFGSRMSDLAETVEALDEKSFKIKNIPRKNCGFSTKNSVFKKNKNLIIISAVFKLRKGSEKDIKNKMKEILSYRKGRHPKLPSAGSVFVNMEIKISDKKLLEKFPELAEFNKRDAIPSAYLIEKCGLKGKKTGRAQISKKHANFIVNLGGAKAKDVLALINLAKKKVKEKFGINLVEEIQIVK